MNDLESKMEGYYIFRYLKEGEQVTNEIKDLTEQDKSSLFAVNVKPIELRTLY